MVSVKGDRRDLMAGLPKGFYDIVGDAAECQYHVLYDFYRIGKRYGFEPAFPSEVGFESTYMSFGTAAHGRGYAFQDGGKRDLMLSSDSLASCIRAFLSLDNTTQVHRMMAKTPVFRHRRKKYRRWNHLIYTIFQEPDDVMAVLSLLEVANQFLKTYYDELTFTISLYGLFESYCEYLNCSHDQMYEALHIRYDRNQDQENEIIAFIKRVEELGKSRKEWRESLGAIAGEYPELASVIDKYSVFFVALEYKGIQFYIDWERYHAIEYSSDICFLVYDATGAMIADGGSYNHIVHSLNPRIEQCYSFACSLEAFPFFDSMRKQEDILYLIKMDCTMEFFFDVCLELREEGYCVYELSAINKLKKLLKRLPEHSTYVCVGSTEENKGEVQIGDKTLRIG